MGPELVTVSESETFIAENFPSFQTLVDALATGDLARLIVRRDGNEPALECDLGVERITHVGEESDDRIVLGKLHFSPGVGYHFQIRCSVSDQERSMVWLSAWPF